MLSRIRAPELSNENIIIRLAESSQEIDAANEIVYQSYIEKGYWQDDRAVLQQNKYFNSPARVVFVVMDQDRVVGSASIIKDSKDRLPSDMFQPVTMQRLRATGDRIAEVSALAVDKSVEAPRNLIMFLFKYVYQYSFYYAGIDRFVVVSTPRHAIFYEKVCLFERLAWKQVYNYVSVEAQLLTVNLVHAHKLFTEKYGPPEQPQSFYRFLLVDDHPSLRFPSMPMSRSRTADWLAEASLLDMPVAV